MTTPGSASVAVARFVCCSGVFLAAEQFGQAEVQNLHAAVVGDEDVLGFQIAMDDALVVRGRETVGDLERVLDGLARAEAAPSDPLAQRLAFEQFLDDVGRVLVRADS